MRQWAATLLIVCAILLAGCGGRSSDSDAPPASGGPTLTETPRATLDVIEDLPRWRIGQSWTYAVEIPGLPTTNFKMVVAEDAEELWIVGAEDREQALHHAMYGTNPVLGRIGKDTLSPFQAGETVSMFDFPLVDRKQWTATFFDETMNFEAHYDDAIATVADVFLPGFHVTATGESGTRVVYNFVPAAEWFTDFQYVDAEGVKQIHLSLQEFGANYVGEYHFLRGHDRAEADFTESAVGPNAVSFQVEEGFDGIGVGIIAEGVGSNEGIVNVTVRNPSNAAVVTTEYILPPGDLETLLDEVDSAAGNWTIEALIVGDATVEVRVVGLHEHAGTL